MQGLEPRTSCTLHSCSYHCTTSVDTHSDFGWYNTVGYGIHLITSPAGWCRTSGAGPAAPSTPAMTLPALASTRTAGSLSPVRSGTGSKCSEEDHSGPTTGTGTVLVARASAMQVPSQTASLVSKKKSAAALNFGGVGMN